MAVERDCGEIGNHWLDAALEYLPHDIFARWSNSLAFLCTSQSDAKRLTLEFRENREIIVLSERIVPAERSDEGSSDVRYFIFAILHEIAHAVFQDRPPRSITPTEGGKQEKRADGLAFQWMNDHLRAKNNPQLPEFTPEELDAAQLRTRQMMQSSMTR